MSKIMTAIKSDTIWNEKYSKETTVKGKLRVVNEYLKEKNMILMPFSKERRAICKIVWSESKCNPRTEDVKRDDGTWNMLSLG